MEMPIYTIWMYDTQKGVKKPIKVVDRAPTDWIELKGLLEEAMRMIWLREGRKEAVLGREGRERKVSLLLLPIWRVSILLFRD